MNNAKPTPFVNMNGTVKARATHRSEFDLPSPKSVTGGDYIYKDAQGGCEAKGYLYTWMITESWWDVPATKSCVLKHNIKTGELVSISEEMELGHANDATYNPDENTILVSFCDGTTRMAILDADTLKLKDIVTLEGHHLCNIHYDPVTKIYVAVAVQCQAVYVYDKDFKLINRFKAFMTPGIKREYVMQGVITDGVYAYVLEWHGGKSWEETNTTIMDEARSKLIVFDLYTGEHVNTIDLGINVEIEYAVYLNGKFYFGCNNSRWKGFELYEVEITTEENA